jgi:hypothetical protein
MENPIITLTLWQLVLAFVPVAITLASPWKLILERNQRT